MKIQIEKKAYNLTVDKTDLAMTLSLPGKKFYYILALLSGCDTPAGRDETLAITSIKHRRRGKADVLIVTERSIRWNRKKYFLECHPDYLLFYYMVQGAGRITKANYFRGLWRGSPIGSAAGFDRVYSACPNFDDRTYFHASESTSIMCGDNPDYRHQGFAGAPFCFGLQAETDKTWVSVGVAARAGEWLFDGFRFNPVHDPTERMNTLAPGGFSLDYDGKMSVKGLWQTPGLVFTFARDEEDCIRRYVNWLHAHRYLKPARRKTYAWWRQPIFCGWREQISMSLKSENKCSGVTDQAPGAVTFCTQRYYERWLGILERKGILPGTIIIDSGWQTARDFPAADREKWPDLRGFVDRCHAQGQKVLLWIGSWARDAAPKNAGITRRGVFETVDPTHPGFERELRNHVRLMIAEMPGCYNADGFKIDGSARFPMGAGLKNHRNLWGMELQKHYIRIYWEEAKKHKPDALVSLFISNPYLEDVTDMVRLGDLYTSKGDPETGMRDRARVIRAAFRCDMPIDTDGAFNFDLRPDWLRLFDLQAEIGIPSLYHARDVYRSRNFRPVRIDRFTSQDYRHLRKIICRYRRRMHLPEPVVQRSASPDKTNKNEA